MSNQIKIAIGCDHAGYDYKENIIKELKNEGYEVTDFGTDSEESVDYPDYVHPLAEAVEKGEADYGILLCGSANGVAMTANKHQNVRAAIAWNEDVAKLARQHNDANIISLPARFIPLDNALKWIKIFLSTPFEGGRHERRVIKIPKS